ncbi:MAG: tyramine oxidase subunit B [Christensenellales bacterium]|nr:tyramine oxidase subunit B [Christensenellales bacterium]
MSGKVDFLYLNEEEMIAAGVKDMPECIQAMEDMFTLLYKGDYRMGGEDANEHGIRVSFPKSSDIEGMPVHAPDYRFMAMPAYLGGRFHMFGIKSYGSHHTNKDKGLPRSILMMSLLDIDTGAPIAYMSANILSAMRTAATAGVGTKYLSNKDPRVLGIIGPGVMSTYTLDAIMVTQPKITTLKVKGRGKASLDKFIGYAKANYPELKTVVACDTIEETCRDSDIIYFGTANAAKFEDNPRIEQEWVKRGALVISASSLLISTDFLSDPGVKLVADNYLMYEGWGAGRELPTQKTVSTLLGMGFYDAVCENKLQRSQIADMGGILLGDQTGRDSEDQIVVYSVGGMPIEDVAWAYDVYKKAIERGVGTKLKVWDEPELMK